MNQVSFSGTAVALVTPFVAGQIDFPTLERLINHVIAGGVDYVVSLGTTGESVTLSPKECRAILDFTIEKVDGRVPIVAGIFGDNNTAALCHKIKHFDFNGIAAILSSSPAYNKPTQEGIYQHYIKVAEHCPVPIIIYNVPSRTASNIEAETILRLATDSSKFVAVKDASGNIVQGTKIIKNKPEHFLVLSGDDPTTLPLLANGGDGVISVIANAYPAEWSKLVTAARNEDLKTAQRLNNLLIDLHQWLYIEGNPAGIKGAMEILGLGNKSVRLPLVELTERNFSKLKKEMKKIEEGNFKAISLGNVRPA